MGGGGARVSVSQRQEAGKLRPPRLACKAAHPVPHITGNICCLAAWQRAAAPAAHPEEGARVGRGGTAARQAGGAARPPLTAARSSPSSQRGWPPRTSWGGPAPPAGGRPQTQCTVGGRGVGWQDGSMQWRPATTSSSSCSPPRSHRFLLHTACSPAACIRPAGKPPCPAPAQARPCAHLRHELRVHAHQRHRERVAAELALQVHGLAHNRVHRLVGQPATRGGRGGGTRCGRSSAAGGAVSCEKMGSAREVGRHRGGQQTGLNAGSGRRVGRALYFLEGI